MVFVLVLHMENKMEMADPLVTEEGLSSKDGARLRKGTTECMNDDVPRTYIH